MSPSAVSSESAITARLSEADWDFRGCDTRYLTHDIHRYSAKFVPQLASGLIKLLSTEGDLILDPLCGSGTTLVEAARLRRRAIGVDINPVAVLISRVKAMGVDPCRVRELAKVHLEDLRLRVVAARTGQMSLDGACPRSQESTWRMEHPVLNKWFPRANLVEADSIQRLIDGSPLDVRPILQVALSDVLRASSYAHSGYPNVMFDKRLRPRRAPAERYAAKVRDFVERIAQLNEQVDMRDVRVVMGDGRQLPIASETVDAIITHPPYIGAVPYAEYQALSLHWLGFEPKWLDRVLWGGRRQSRDVVERFLNSSELVFAEMWRVLKPGGYSGLLVGNPVVRRERVPLHSIFHQRLEEHGWKYLGAAARKRTNMRANKLPDEWVMVFRKPMR
jgi:DNA modification methylase